MNENAQLLRCNISNVDTKIIKPKQNIINSKQHLLMISLKNFFINEENINKMLYIIDGTSKISLRILDWFVTNYAKKNNVIYDVINNKTNSSKKFIVYLDYKSQLKAYSKKQFDPFCRRERIEFEYSTLKNIETTVGQLNFFRWCIQHNIIEYIEDNIETIEHDMNQSMRDQYKNNVNTDGANSKRKKRHELSISATKTINKHNVKIYVSFN
jgi:hypothetical protein